MTNTLAFNDVEIPDVDRDTVPETNDVDYPCRVCGQEAGPYGGRGPKPKLCSVHKKATKGSASKVTGTVANQAAQATAVLVQLNGIVSILAMGVGLFGTAQAIAGANETFEQQAFNALITDPELCRLILKGGVKSGKLALGIAYAGMGTVVVPTAYAEIKEKKAERDAAREAALNETGA